MTFLVLFWVNVVLLAIFAVILQRPGLLGFAKGGRWYLTWLSVGVITLMDELTSIFYAPAEAHRFIGMQAIFFIAFTSLIMRVLSTRMVEIAQILELHDIRGGGVYSFSYFVLGPVASFVAVASIMVDYILTACISTVSAVYNGTALFPIGPGIERVLIIAIIWAIAGLNILGIRENARVTFGIFVAPLPPGISWDTTMRVAPPFARLACRAKAITIGSATGQSVSVSTHLGNAVTISASRCCWSPSRSTNIAGCFLAHLYISSSPFSSSRSTSRGAISRPAAIRFSIAVQRAPNTLGG